MCTCVTANVLFAKLLKLIRLIIIKLNIPYMNAFPRMLLFLPHDWTSYDEIGTVAGN